MTDSLYLVLNGPFSSKPPSRGMICLVAPITTSATTPRLIATGDRAPLKGQVLDLNFNDESSVNWRVVQFDEKRRSRLQEFYHSKHGTLITKNDWSEPVLQQYYALEHLVELTSQDQRVLCDLLKQRPHVLLFQDFKSLPRLTFPQYTHACSCFDVHSPYSAQVIIDAQRYLKELEYLYLHNVSTPRGIFDNYCNPESLTLLESVCLTEDEHGEYSWDVTRRFEGALRDQLDHFSTGHSFVNDYIRSRAAASPWPTEQDVAECFHSRLVVLGTGKVPAYRIDLELELILRWAKDNGVYIDLSFGYTIHRVQSLCLTAKYLFLHNAHLISVPALVGLLRILPNELDGLVLYYDCNYANRTSRFLDTYPVTHQVTTAWLCDDPDDTTYGLMTVAYWTGRLNAKTLPNGYSFNVPVSWMAPTYIQRFLEFYWKVRHEAVVLVPCCADFIYLDALFASEQTSGRLPGPLHSDIHHMESGEPVTMLDDIFGGLLRFSEQLSESVCSATTEGSFTINNYNFTDLIRLRCVYLGLCKYRPKYVFFYTTKPLTRNILYKLVSHARSNVFINCNLDLLCES